MIIGRDELIAQVWAGTHVTKAVLKVAVRAIREALGDEADAPQYVETVGREGYRFIANDAPGTRTPASTRAPAPVVVGRTNDLAELRAAFERARAGAPQIVFVSGEAGIGKTTLIDRFVDELEHGRRAEIARGQCLEQYGESEAYLPVLEAVGGLLRAHAAHELETVLQQHAPTWVPLLPAIEQRSTADTRADAGDRHDAGAHAPRDGRCARGLHERPCSRARARGSPVERPLDRRPDRVHRPAPPDEPTDGDR